MVAEKKTDAKKPAKAVEKKAAAPKAEKKVAAAGAATPKAAEAERKDRRKLVGEVTSDKMDKTVVVRVVHRVRSAQYLKYMTKRVKYKAHDEKNEYKTGDTRRDRRVSAAVARQALACHAARGARSRFGRGERLSRL